MQKTAKEIEGDVYALLRESSLPDLISGDIYRDGMRPRDSRLEDAEVVWTTGLPGQIQNGVVTIKIYVPDIDPYGNGVLVENGKRTEEIEVFMQVWVENLTAGEYLFSLQSTIATDASDERPEHFVSVALEYRYYGGEERRS